MIDSERVEHESVKALIKLNPEVWVFYNEHTLMKEINNQKTWEEFKGITKIYHMKQFIDTYKLHRIQESSNHWWAYYKQLDDTNVNQGIPPTLGMHRLNLHNHIVRLIKTLELSNILLKQIDMPNMTLKKEVLHDKHTVYILPETLEHISKN